MSRHHAARTTNLLFAHHQQALSQGDGLFEHIKQTIIGYMVKHGIVPQ